jgi:hypothetical protein
MSAFNQVLIGGYPSGGLMTDKKPMMLPNEAFSNLQNAYVWRDRVKKRDGSVTVGRLSVAIINTSLGNSGASPWTVNIFSTVSPAITFPYAQLKPGTVIITIGTLVLIDNGLGVLEQSGTITAASNANPVSFTSVAHHLITGEQVVLSGFSGNWSILNGQTFTVTVTGANTFTIPFNSTPLGAYPPGGKWISINATNFGTINYITSVAVITTNVAGGTATTVSFAYYPSLPVMGILKQDVATIGIDQTIFFDTTYSYQFVGGAFQQLTTTTWTGTNTDFFWAANYQGADPSLKYFFATNDNIALAASTPYDPIRYFNNSVWTSLQPFLTNPSGTAIQLWQALILIPYYGRLLALNTWEGVASGGDPTLPATSVQHYSARCTFSQIGDPTDETLGWRRDIFGRGGFLDAPTNESIVGAAFHRNTLIVFFEYSTWQLRYIGEYGLPFIFERISSDFGAVSTYSSIVFDQGVMTVSDRGVIQASAGGLKRLDEQIPETIFSFQIQNSAPNFVHGIRDFEKEIVYWNYVDTSNMGVYQSYPNTVLLFNYRNNTWAQYRDTITCFGPAQFTLGINWDSLTTFWDSDVSWDNVDDQNYVEYVTAGNQQGFISIYENPDAETPVSCPINYGPSLFIYSIDLTAVPITIVSPSHNIQNQPESGGETIFINGTLWNGTDPGLNGNLYLAVPKDANTLQLFFWNGTNYAALSSDIVSTYIGNGVISLCPIMNIVGKDFNPYQSIGKQYKVSYIDFLMDTNNHYPTIPAVTIQLFVNSYLEQANQMMFGNQELSNSSLKSGYIQNIALADSTMPPSTTNPWIITSEGHSLRTGTLIYISNVIGLTNFNSLPNYNMIVIDANRFSVINASATGTYTPNSGIWNSVNATGGTYLQGTEYAWYRFYSNQFGQFLRVAMTFDNALMNQISTHQTGMQLHAMNFFFREAGRLVNA